MKLQPMCKLRQVTITLLNARVLIYFPCLMYWRNSVRLGAYK